MADQQWQSTADHAPPAQEWQNTADHAQAPPSATSRFITGTGLADSFSNPLQTARRGVGIITPSDLKAAWDTVSAIASKSNEHFQTALKASEQGDYAKATEHAIYAIPALGEQGKKIIDDFKGGNYAGALGGIASAVLPLAAGAGAAKFGEAASAVGSAVADSKAATMARDFVKGAAPELPVVKQVLTGPIKGGLAEVQRAADVRAAAAAAERPAYTPPTAAGKPGVTQVPASAVQPIQYEQGAGHFGEAAPTAPVPTTPATRVPLWQQGQAPAQQVSLSSLAEMSPEQIQAAARQRFADNLAARQTANQQSPAAMVDRLKALGATSDADQAAQPQAPTTQVPLSNLATPHDLTSQLKAYLDQLRAADPDYEGPAEPAKPDMVDVLQRSIDAAKAKRSAKQ